jgi:hypothetical protein
LFGIDMDENSNPTSAHLGVFAVMSVVPIVVYVTAVLVLPVGLEGVPLGCAGARLGFGKPSNECSVPKLQPSRSGIAMLGEAGVKIPITAPNAIATATASAIKMTNTARIAAAPVMKDSGLSCSARYVMCAGIRCVDMHARSPLIP